MTACSSLNGLFALRDHSSAKNLLTACDLDLPICLADGFLGNGTMNLPSFECEWVELKCSTTIRSSVESVECSAGDSSISQNCWRMSSPDVTVLWNVVTQACADEVEDQNYHIVPSQIQFRGL